MTVKDLVGKLNADIIVMADFDREIEDGYCGDFLSNVMGKAPQNSAWYTVMNNVNVAAVAYLANVSVVVICEGVKPDLNLVDKATIQGINIISTEADVYDAVRSL
jgi:hypothetical protein